MANATPVRTIGQHLPARSPESESPPTSRIATHAPTPSGKPFGAPESRAARAAAHAKRQQWAAMNLRQQWADEDFMRGHLRVAGIRITVNSEPATVKRVKAKLWQAGVDSPEAQAAVGMSLAKWLAANPRMPLWAALALVLEGTGRFTPDDNSQPIEAMGACLTPVVRHGEQRQATPKAPAATPTPRAASIINVGKLDRPRPFVRTSGDMTENQE